MKIYTRTGDEGETSLFSGGRVRKDHGRVEAYGTIDELNSVLGVARASQPPARLDDWLAQVQTQLFHLGADLATPLDAKADWVVRIEPPAIAWLEETIDTMTSDLPSLAHFILPGGTAVAAHLHVARTVCRRAERIIVTVAEDTALGPDVIPYVNRLSDWLFTAARYANHLAGVDETTWRPRG